MPDKDAPEERLDDELDLELVVVTKNSDQKLEEAARVYHLLHTPLS